MYSLHAATILTDIDCGRTALETIEKGNNKEANEHLDIFSAPLMPHMSCSSNKEKKKPSAPPMMKARQRIKANDSFI